MDDLGHNAGHIQLIAVLLIHIIPRFTQPDCLTGQARKHRYDRTHYAYIISPSQATLTYRSLDVSVSY